MAGSNKGKSNKNSENNGSRPPASISKQAELEEKLAQRRKEREEARRKREEEENRLAEEEDRRLEAELAEQRAADERERKQQAELARIEAESLAKIRAEAEKKKKKTSKKRKERDSEDERTTPEPSRSKPKKGKATVSNTLDDEKIFSHKKFQATAEASEEEKEEMETPCARCVDDGQSCYKRDKGRTCERCAGRKMSCSLAGTKRGTGGRGSEVKLDRIVEVLEGVMSELRGMKEGINKWVERDEERERRRA